MIRVTIAWLLVLLAAGPALAQRGWGRGGGQGWISEEASTAREVPQHTYETPAWTNAPGFAKDTFTFARVRYDPREWGRGGRGTWTTDLPDSDLNLSYRLQQMTSLRVDPDGRILRLTDPAPSIPFSTLWNRDRCI